MVHGMGGTSWAEQARSPAHPGCLPAHDQKPNLFQSQEVSHWRDTEGSAHTVSLKLIASVSWPVMEVKNNRKQIAEAEYLLSR